MFFASPAACNDNAAKLQKKAFLGQNLIFIFFLLIQKLVYYKVRVWSHSVSYSFCLSFIVWQIETSIGEKTVGGLQEKSGGKSHHHSRWQHWNVFCWLFSSFNIYFIFQQWIKGCLTIMLERMKHCKNTIEEGGRMVWTMWPISIAMVVTVLMWIVTQGSTTVQPRTSQMRRTKEDFRRALNNEQPAGEILDRVPAWIEKSDGRTNP